MRELDLLLLDLDRFSLLAFVKLCVLEPELSRLLQFDRLHVLELDRL